MHVYEIIKQRRTIRKFKQTPLNHQDILQIIDCARLAPYAANLQPLKFSVVTDEVVRRAMFPHIQYAGYLPEWNPAFEECPPVFIVVFNDTTIKPTKNAECDSGAAIMSMCLGAKELGIDSCWLGAIEREAIKKLLGLDAQLDITYLLGLGYADQTAEIFESNDTIRYQLDADSNVHVPKKPLADILV